MRRGRTHITGADIGFSVDLVEQIVSGNPIGHRGPALKQMLCPYQRVFFGQLVGHPCQAFSPGTGGRGLRE